LLHGGCQKRFSIIQETAKEQSAAVGDADLRRMKRQFSSLKNTFLHYEVKDEFIAALADGLPNGTEEIQLTQFEEELARNVDLLRSLKGRNAETQEEIAGFISQIGTALEELDKQKSTSASILSRLQQEMEQDKQAEAAMPPPVPAGTDEAECLASLADMAAEARALEAKIVEQMAKLAEEEAALRIEQEETEVAKAVAADLAAQRDAHGDMAETSSRFADSAAWAQHAIALLQPLGGVTVLKADKDELDLQLSAAYPTVAVAGGCVGACRTGTHRLTVQLDPSSGAVTGATLFPGDIDAADIVEAAIAGSRGPDFVVSSVG